MGLTGAMGGVRAGQGRAGVFGGTVRLVAERADL